MTPGVMIGIPTYNRWRGVADLLLNLRQRTPADIPHEIVVCDDSGKESHREQVRRVCQEYGVRYVQNGRNSGVAASWNTLVRSSDREMCVILNDDVFVAPNWLRPLHYAVMNNERVGSVSLNCLFIEAGDAKKIIEGPNAQVVPLNVRWVGNHLVRNERFTEMPVQGDGSPGRVMCPMGALFGFRRSVYDQVGGFDERYFAFYEETDFGCSMAHRGMPTFTLAYPFDNYHIWSATFGSAPEIPSGKIMSESRAKFVQKWSQILGITFKDAPDIHPILMDKIEKFPVKWLGVGGIPREEVL